MRWLYTSGVAENFSAAKPRCVIVTRAPALLRKQRTAVKMSASNLYERKLTPDCIWHGSCIGREPQTKIARLIWESGSFIGFPRRIWRRQHSCGRGDTANLTVAWCRRQRPSGFSWTVWPMRAFTGMREVHCARDAIRLTSYNARCRQQRCGRSARPNRQDAQTPPEGAGPAV